MWNEMTTCITRAVQKSVKIVTKMWDEDNFEKCKLAKR